jgi:hypothetical protein
LVDVIDFVKGYCQIASKGRILFLQPDQVIFTQDGNFLQFGQAFDIACFDARPVHALPEAGGIPVCIGNQALKLGGHLLVPFGRGQTFE